MIQDQTIGAPGQRYRTERVNVRPVTEPISQSDLHDFLGDDVEPVDLNQSRSEIKPTTWH